MSIIDEILVIIDDNPKISREQIYKQIKSHQKQIISSSLGRLMAKGWISNTKKNNITTYQISNAGQDQLDNNLANLRLYKATNNYDKFLVIVFDIPEKNRKYRDDLRNYLQNHGFGRLHSSIWISYCNLSKNLKKYIKNNSIEKYITYLYTQKMSVSEQKELIKKISWDWKKLNLQYNNFILKSRAYLRSKNKSSYLAKSLVLSFSKILGNDPKLPSKLTPNDSRLHEAYEYYLKIRRYCYKN